MPTTASPAAACSSGAAGAPPPRRTTRRPRSPVRDRVSWPGSRQRPKADSPPMRTTRRPRSSRVVERCVTEVEQVCPSRRSRRTRPQSGRRRAGSTGSRPTSMLAVAVKFESTASATAGSGWRSASPSRWSAASSPGGRSALRRPQQVRAGGQRRRPGGQPARSRGARAAWPGSRHRFRRPARTAAGPAPAFRRGGQRAGASGGGRGQEQAGQGQRGHLAAGRGCADHRGSGSRLSGRAWCCCRWYARLAVARLPGAVVRMRAVVRVIPGDRGGFGLRGDFCAL